MRKYLITGRGGTGKSTICLELKRRGYPAFDADKVTGLCRWEDRKTGEPIEVDPSVYIDFTKIAWAWQDVVLQKLFYSHPDLILCGSASNQEDYYSRFNGIFVLTLDKQTHDFRLRSRDREYGKHPKMRNQLVERQQIFAKNLISENGAIAVDATQSIEKVADDILRHINHER